LLAQGEVFPSLAKLLMKSHVDKFLAVRQVAQDESGKKTAGVDGVKLPTIANDYEWSEVIVSPDDA
jgi:retron-type reverse transcriptase